MATPNNNALANGAPDSQANVTNDQTFNIDIRQFYNDIITAIDKIRSHVSVSLNADVITTGIRALTAAEASSNGANVGDPYQFLQQLKTDPKNPQETRCHAFYRLIGLPVVGSDGTLYSPGYDISTNTLKDPKSLQKRLNVINKIDTKLFLVMNAREDNVRNFSDIFSRSNQASGLPDINASVLSLSSVANGNVRKFAAALDNNSAGPFDTTISNQAYPVGDRNGLLLNTAKLMSAPLATPSSATGLPGYLGPDGQPANIILAPTKNVLKESPLKKRAHIIKPFMVDPRVDLTVNPPNGQVCAPFPDDKSKTLYAQDIYLSRPFIETICRFRFNKFQNQFNPSNTQGANSQAYQDIKSFIKSTTNLRNQDLLTQLANDPLQTIESQILFKYINIMNSMVIKLHEALQHIHTAENEHQWIPIPDVNGPEFGMITPTIFFVQGSSGAQLDPIIQQNYPDDQNIASLNAQIQLQNISASVPTPDLGNFAFQGIDMIPDDKATQAFGSQLQEHLDDLIKKRDTVCSQAADALQTVEIIMGEFSGFGLCDILAIFTALWTVDKKVLVNMLDVHAFQRLYSDPTLRDPVVEARGPDGTFTLNGKDVLQQFEDQVKQMYLIMDKLYENVVKNNTTSS